MGNEKQIHRGRERRGEARRGEVRRGEEKIAIALKRDLTQISQSLNVKCPDCLVFRFFMRSQHLDFYMKMLPYLNDSSSTFLKLVTVKANHMLLWAASHLRATI